jgi:hypothetical protein
MKPALITGLVILMLLLVTVCVCARLAHCQFGAAVPLQEPERLAKRYMWPAAKQSMVHEAGYRVATLLKKADIVFWPMCGTLIGALRHEGVIPWDDDVDLGVWEEDMHRVKPALEAGDASKVTNVSELLPGLKLGMLQVEYSDLPRVHVDVVSMQLRGDDVRQSSAILRKLYPRDAFKKSELLPIKPGKLPFGPHLMLPSPHDANAAADRIAPGFMNTAVVTCNHAAYLNPWGSVFLRKRSFRWPLHGETDEIVVARVWPRDGHGAGQLRELRPPAEEPAPIPSVGGDPKESGLQSFDEELYQP